MKSALYYLSNFVLSIALIFQIGGYTKKVLYNQQPAAHGAANTKSQNDSPSQYNSTFENSLEYNSILSDILAEQDITETLSRLLRKDVGRQGGKVPVADNIDKILIDFSEYGLGTIDITDPSIDQGSFPVAVQIAQTYISHLTVNSMTDKPYEDRNWQNILIGLRDGSITPIVSESEIRRVLEEWFNSSDYNISGIAASDFWEYNGHGTKDPALKALALAIAQAPASIGGPFGDILKNEGLVDLPAIDEPLIGLAGVKYTDKGQEIVTFNGAAYFSKNPVISAIMGEHQGNVFDLMTGKDIGSLESKFDLGYENMNSKGLYSFGGEERAWLMPRDNDGEFGSEYSVYIPTWNLKQGTRITVVTSDGHEIELNLDKDLQIPVPSLIQFYGPISFSEPVYTELNLPEVVTIVDTEYNVPNIASQMLKDVDFIRLIREFAGSMQITDIEGNVLKRRQTTNFGVAVDWWENYVIHAMGNNPLKMIIPISHLSEEEAEHYGLLPALRTHPAIDISQVPGDPNYYLTLNPMGNPVEFSWVNYPYAGYDDAWGDTPLEIVLGRNVVVEGDKLAIWIGHGVYSEMQHPFLEGDPVPSQEEIQDMLSRLQNKVNYSSEPHVVYKMASLGRLPDKDRTPSSSNPHFHISVPLVFPDNTRVIIDPAILFDRDNGIDIANILESNIIVNQTYGLPFAHIGTGVADYPIAIITPEDIRATATPIVLPTEEPTQQEEPTFVPIIIPSEIPQITFTPVYETQPPTITAVPTEISTQIIATEIPKEEPIQDLPESTSELKSQFHFEFYNTQLEYRDQDIYIQNGDLYVTLHNEFVSSFLDDPYNILTQTVDGYSLVLPIDKSFENGSLTLSVKSDVYFKEYLIDSIRLFRNAGLDDVVLYVAGQGNYVSTIIETGNAQNKVDLVAFNATLTIDQ